MKLLQGNTVPKRSGTKGVESLVLPVNASLWSPINQIKTTCLKSRQGHHRYNLTAHCCFLIACIKRHHVFSCGWLNLPLPAVSSQPAVARSDLLCELKKPHDSVISANQSSSAASSLIRTKTFHALLPHYSRVVFFFFIIVWASSVSALRQRVGLSAGVVRVCVSSVQRSAPLVQPPSHRLSPGLQDSSLSGGKGRDTLTWYHMCF